MDEVKNLQTEEQEKLTVDPVLEEMAKAGILFGRRRMWTNPKMREFVFTNRNGVEIFDLTKTLQAIEKAGEALKTAVKTGKPILIVGTSPAAQAAVLSLAKEFSYPFVVERWLGGTLTNFSAISERLNYYLRLKSDLESGKLDKYTKKERVEMDKEIERLTKLFGGLEKMTTMPSALLVVSAAKHTIAIKEAKDTGVPVVAIANSDANPDVIDFLIPANDNSKAGIEWITQRLGKYIQEGLKEKSVAPAPKTEEKKA